MTVLMGKVYFHRRTGTLKWRFITDSMLSYSVLRYTANFFKKEFPKLTEDDVVNPFNGIISIPQKAPDNAILRTENETSLLERIKYIHKTWIQNGHNFGKNTHNVSSTINVKDGNWEIVKNWMWENRHYYNGISIFPFSEPNYAQLPFENCSKEKYEEMISHLHTLDLSLIKETEDGTDLLGEIACFGNQCEII